MSDTQSKDIVREAMQEAITEQPNFFTEGGRDIVYFKKDLHAAFEKIKKHHEDNWDSMLDEGAILLLNQLIESLK